MANDSYILNMNGVSKRFPGVNALDNVKFKLKKGSVHALLGANGAGKSTLMKCLLGIYSMDEGNITYGGEKIRITSERNALKCGISMVHQEPNQTQPTRVMDNIWLGRFPMNGIFVDEDKIYHDTLEIFNSLNVNIDPEIKMEKLSVFESQIVEIAKAISNDSKIIILDEPTSLLNEEEVEHLFRVINSLKERGISIVYISHKVKEVSRISDQVTVMRDGKCIATKDTTGIVSDEIGYYMVSEDSDNKSFKEDNKASKVLLEVKNLTGLYNPKAKDVSFALR